MVRLITLMIISLYFFCLPGAQAQTITNLLPNGDFETGNTSPWQGITTSALTAADVHSGSYAMNIISNGTSIGADGPFQGWITVTPGRTYVFSGWFKWTEFGGAGWGYDTLSVTNDDWSNAGVINNLHASYEANKWHKIALTFTARTGAVQVGFGMYGPRERVNLYFDDIMLFEKSGNIIPTIDPQADVSSGSVPLSVSFQANGDDPDGAIQYFQWDFGDGSSDIVENPAHIYQKRGNYAVTLRAWDNEGALIARSISITVTDNASPVVTIAQPTDQLTFETNQDSVTLSGSAIAVSGQITSLAWDNINTDQAGIINIAASQNINWATPAVSLKPGKNEILITAIDSNGLIDARSIAVSRQISSPAVKNIFVSTSTPRVYERYEVKFDLDTVADNSFFTYDENPPVGVPARVGVLAEGIFTSPSGKILKQPAFAYTDVVRSGSGTNISYFETNTKGWAVRFSPQEEGIYQAALHIKDASGEINVPAGSFTAQAPVKKGFVKVSKDDSRYFEYSNADLFWPTGPAGGNDYSKYKDTGVNLERPWMGGSGAYSTNWSRWMSSSEGFGNEGIMARLNFREHYPGHELSRDLFYPNGFRIWIAEWGDNEFHDSLKPSANYQVKLRLKTQNISGPRDPAYPDYGFVIKQGGFLSHQTSVVDVENALRNNPVILPHIRTSRGWHTVIGNFRTGVNIGSVGSDFNLYLDNVSSGQAYIDEFSLKEILIDGSLGPEMVRQKRSDMHNYVDQKPAAAFDWQVEQGEQNDVFFKYVVQDKNDWVPNHLLSNGMFYSSGHGYYQGDNTKAGWLQQQWWRYLIARWGYSTAIHSWELNNEGSPTYTSHYRRTQEFAKFMHDHDPQRHLASTSFWSYVPADFPNFWGNQAQYPDVDYADIHRYSDMNTFPDGTLEGLDAAAFQSYYSQETRGLNPGKPVIRGETGIADPWSGGQATTIFNYLRQPNPGIWYHNLIWAQLNSGGMSDFNYWWAEHFNALTNSKETIAKPFYRFIKDLDINKGGYIEAAASVSNPNLRVYGQKNTVKQKAHLWIQNKNHTWRNVMGVLNPAPVGLESGVVTLQMNPDTDYTIEWWDTYSVAIPSSEVKKSDAAGNLTLDITNLRDDAAVKVYRAGYIPPLLRGDINSDTFVNVLDVQACVNHILGIQDLGTRADVNGDGSVNVLDVQNIVNIILGV